MTLRERYNRDGYVVIKDAISKFSANSVLSNIQSLSNRVPCLEQKERYISTLSLCSKLHCVNSVFQNLSIRKALTNIGLVERAYHAPSIHVMNEHKIPDMYYGTVAHQDWASVQGSLDMVTVWVPLHPTKDNYPLENIPESHLGGLRQGTEKDSVLEIDCPENEFIPIECDVGDVVIMSGFLIHRTSDKGKFRVAISQRFENINEPTFIERGYPCAQKRTVNREFITSNFPSIEQVREIFQ